MIQIKNLFLKYTREYYALYDVNMEIAEGESVGFVGEDESGKTSLLRVLAKLEKPSKGEIYIKDIPLEKLDYKTDLKAGYVPATPVFFERKTVEENFRYILKIWGEDDEKIESKINGVFKEFSIESLRDKKIKDLSLEEKYVLSLIRLSLRQLDLLMVDNIFDIVSDGTREVLIKFIKKLKTEKTVLLVASTKPEIVKKLCKRNYYFKDGSVSQNKEDLK